MFGTTWSDQLKAFDREHGESVCVKGVLYFIDGATREAGDAPLHAGCFPPTDARELRQRMQIFWQKRLNDAITSFRETKRALARRARTSLINDAELQHVKDLQKAVRDAQKQRKSWDEPKDGPTEEQVQDACKAYNAMHAALKACDAAEQRYREKSSAKRLETWQEAYEQWQECKAAWDGLSEGQRNAVLALVNEELRDRQERILNAIEV